MARKKRSSKKSAGKGSGKSKPAVLSLGRARKSSPKVRLGKKAAKGGGMVARRASATSKTRGKRYK